jgi:hypothetical protein
VGDPHNGGKKKFRVGPTKKKSWWSKSTDFDELDTLRAKVGSVLHFEDRFDDFLGSQSVQRA